MMLSAIASQVLIASSASFQAPPEVAALAAPLLGGAIRAKTFELEGGAPCEPDWLPAFGAMPGVTGLVRDLLTFDDGSGTGPALYVGGDFQTAGGVQTRAIARWDGASWTSVGGGIGGYVHALAVFDDGSGGGPALYAAGEIETAGGVVAWNVARWDGSSWSALGSGLGFPWENQVVEALAVYDDGFGPALYATGRFWTSGGLPVSRIAKWDGTSWSALGSGLQGSPQDWPYALAVHDDGSGGGSELYVGGSFYGAGGVPATGIAKWNGSSWSAVGGGISGTVLTLEEHDDGSGGGPALYAGGGFTAAGGVSAYNVAKWDGTSWSALGSGIITAVFDLATHDDGTGAGPALYAAGNFLNAGGTFASRIARWDGASWSAVGGGVNDWAFALTVYQAPGDAEPRLYAGGTFTRADEWDVLRIASWDGSAWSPIGTATLNAEVIALAEHDDGSGRGAALYAGGSFGSAAAGPSRRIAKWEGSAWADLAGGMDDSVLALAVHDDGSGGGPALYAGGEFTASGGATTNRIAKWNGSNWTALGSGMNGAVNALAVHDDGSGPALYAGGSFTVAGGVAANRIARWNGASWSALGSGVTHTVRALAVFDDGGGGGPALYAGGDFITAGGISANRMARWNGTSWDPLGGGMTGPVRALAVHDDGTGEALYAGGDFSMAGGMSIARIAKWDGSSWSALGPGLNDGVWSLAVYDDGTGEGDALYAGGRFTASGATSLERIARWDGSSWTALGEGFSGTGGPRVRALLVHDDSSGAGPVLLAGGDFLFSPTDESFIAKWGGCAVPDAGVPYCFGDGSGAPCPCANPGGSGQGCANSTGLGARLAGNGSRSVAADDLTLRVSNLGPAQPALLFAGTNAVNGGDGIAFGDGLRCAGGAVQRLGIRLAGPTGVALWGPGLAAAGGWTAGDVRRFQVWYRDPTNGPCMSGFNLSNGHVVLFVR